MTLRMLAIPHLTPRSTPSRALHFDGDAGVVLNATSAGSR